MLFFIAKHVRIIEEHLASIESNKTHDLREIIALLKKTYQESCGEIEPTLSLKHTIGILDHINEQIKTNPHKYFSADIVSCEPALTSISNWTRCASFIKGMRDDLEGMQFVLPIRQSLDKNVNGGQCHGFVLDWAQKMYRYGSWIERKRTPLFEGEIKIAISEEERILNQVLFSEVETKNHSPFNRLHLAPITPNHISLNRSQHLHWHFEILISDLQFIHSVELFNSTKILTDKLLTLANQHINQPIEIWLTNILMFNSHTVALIKTSDKYLHFMDANCGYLRFKDENTFKEWFPKYFHQYSYLFTGYRVIPRAKNLKEEQPPTDINKCFNITKEMIYFFIAFPIALSIHICNAVFLLLTQIIMRPWNICRYVSARHALLNESSQVYDDICKSFYDRGRAEYHSKSDKTFFFTTDMQLEMKEFSQVSTKKTTSHITWSSRFFCCVRREKHEMKACNDVSTLQLSATANTL